MLPWLTVITLLEKRVGPPHVRRNNVGDGVTLIRTQPLGDSAENRCLTRADGAVHVDRADPVAGHVLVLSNRLLDLTGIEKISGVRPKPKRLLIQSKISKHGHNVMRQVIY